MSGQPRPLFDSSFAALALLNARHGPGKPPVARRPVGTLGVAGGRSTAMSIQFAPEPDPTAHVVDLGEDQTTGPLPLGFEFEFFGVLYTWFDLSSDGFMTLGTHPFPYCPGSHSRSHFIPLNPDLNNFIALGWTEGYMPGRRQVTYEVRGIEQRHRLVLSFRAAPAPAEDGHGTMSAQLILHERTGMIDLHTRCPEQVAPQGTQEAVRYTTAPW